MLSKFKPECSESTCSFMRVFTVFVNFVKEGTKKEKTSCVKEERLKFCYILLFNLELKYNKNYYLL